jgi:hypothetical protein
VPSRVRGVVAFAHGLEVARVESSWTVWSSFVTVVDVYRWRSLLYGFRFAVLALAQRMLGQVGGSCALPCTVVSARGGVGSFRFVGALARFALASVDECWAARCVADLQSDRSQGADVPTPQSAPLVIGVLDLVLIAAQVGSPDRNIGCGDLIAHRYRASAKVFAGLQPFPLGTVIHSRGAPGTKRYWQTGHSVVAGSCSTGSSLSGISRAPSCVVRLWIVSPGGTGVAVSTGAGRSPSVSGTVETFDTSCSAGAGSGAALRAVVCAIATCDASASGAV